MDAVPPVSDPALFRPLTLRGVTIPNRVGVSPMCMYSSTDGAVTDFHLVHLGRFALGGAGLVVMEATAVTPAGRISPRDAGLWSDDHLPGLRRIAGVLTEQGSVPGIQLGHAGRRAAVTEPWHGGQPLVWSETEPGREPWALQAPSAAPAGPEWPTPRALSESELTASLDLWAAAARRASEAGFRFLELHGAHGYLLHSFLSPLSNHRSDAYGGTPEARMRYPLEVVRAVRASLPAETALSYRVSTVDGIDGGLTLDDTVVFAERLAEAGVDIIDTSSGGITTDRSVDTRVRRGFAFHADFSRAVRERVGIPTATVGLIVDPQQADALIDHGDADLVLLGRTALDDPNWPNRARHVLGAVDPTADPRFESYLTPWRAGIERLLARGESPLSRFEIDAPEEVTGLP
ncbi:NADH:flavin oxidoreductase/NADH oxidase [Microcella pacifica]|uniref:NADH:flavin oxidoreductase/NADH oxidase n=1 Tax=Microcella pacifica TaxID=2591847 RepID=A0A9E5JM56_9MICO|nr:NADH:flavin oxidoreductase/NADH oxidase [Microcella pacifica]NHF62169.1 NADH:flavin oxidoreductase/NADH oxidase [Microcella pacifica]